MFRAHVPVHVCVRAWLQLLPCCESVSKQDVMCCGVYSRARNSPLPDDSESHLTLPVQCSLHCATNRATFHTKPQVLGASHKGSGGVGVDGAEALHEMLLISGPGAVSIGQFLRRLGLDFVDDPEQPQDAGEGRASQRQQRQHQNCDSSSPLSSSCSAEAATCPGASNASDHSSSPIRTQSHAESIRTPGSGAPPAVDGVSCQHAQGDGNSSSSQPPALPDLAPFDSPAALLESWGADRIKLELQRLGLKSGGRPEQRAELLFSLKGVGSLSEVPRKHFARKGGDSSKQK